MNKTLFARITSALLPLGMYAAPVSAAPRYLREYAGSAIEDSVMGAQPGARRPDAPERSNPLMQHGDTAGGLQLVGGRRARELLVIDAAVPDKERLRRGARAGMEIVEIDDGKPGLPQLIEILARHRGLDAVHIVSHGEAGALLLGNSRVTAETLNGEIQAFAALNGALREGADLLLYGCDLANGAAGEALLEILQRNTHADIAGSNDLTGSEALGGDWDLEIVRGNVATGSAFSDKATRDFSGVLQFTGTINFSQTKNAGDYYGNATVNAEVWATGTSGYFLIIDGLTRATELYTGLGSSGQAAFTLNTENSVTLRFNNNEPFSPQSLKVANIAGGGGTTHSFTFTSNKGSFSRSIVNGTPATVDLTSFGGNVTYITISSSLVYAWLDDFSVVGVGVSSAPPVVTDARISISGASGTGGAYKIGDTVTATWNNTAGGDNNVGITGVTVDFSQFGGAAAVVATNSSDAWTATYTVTSGAIDAANRNVSVTATNADGPTTTADTTNATVDSVAPTVSDARISISGASGTGGAFKIGDTVTASWNNTAGGDNNSDTISSVRFDFSQFGGGAAVVASNSSGTWTATYTITAGLVDGANRNVSVTATDNAGNTATTADTSNATVDSVAPVVSNANIGISGATGTGGAYKVGDTVTASWDNSAIGDDNSDTISGASVDFSAFGGGAAVAATNSSGTWTATYTITAGAIDATNRNVSVSAADNAGNTTTTADTTNATVDNVAPTVTDARISISGASGSGGAFKVGDTITATWNNTAGGDNNSDTISSVNVDFSQFGGGAAVVASNSSGTWTANYTITAGAIDATNRNVSVTAADNAGNTRTQADSSNATIDAAAPAVTSVSVPANGTYAAGNNLDFTVNFSENITVNTGGGIPLIALTLDTGGIVNAQYLSGSGTSAVTFRYTVANGNADSNGIAVGAMDANGGTLKDAAGNDASLALNNVGSTAAVLVDAVAPTISSVSVPTAATYVANDNLDFTVNSSESVIVNTGGGTPRIALTIGAATRYASYLSGSGTAAVTYRYTVQPGDDDTDGIAVGAAVDANGGTVRDQAGNDLVPTLNAVGGTSGVLVDSTAPTLQSLNPADDSTTVATGADFVMTFSESIALGSGNIVVFDSSNNAIATIDVAAHGGQLAVSGGQLTINPAADLVGSTSYYIQVANGAVTDAAGLAYAGIADTTSWNFTVADVTPPSVTAITVSGTPGASDASIAFTVDFDEVASSISIDDFVLTATGTVAGTIASVSATTGSSVTVTVNGISGSGTLRLDLLANTNITDAAGNGNNTNGYVAAFTTGGVHTLDREAPAAPAALDLAAASDSGSSNSDNITSVTTPTVSGTAEAGSSIALSSDQGGAIGTATADGSGNWTLATSALVPNVTHMLTATATDAAGNASAASVGLAVTIDTDAPAITSTAATGAAAGDASVAFAVVFDEAVAGVSTAGFALATTGTAAGTIASVSAAAGSNVTVTVNAISGTGTLRLDSSGIGISDVAGNPAAAFSAGSAHSVDLDAPAITGVAFDQASVDAANQNAISVTLAGAETGTTADYTISGSSGMPATGSAAVTTAAQQISGIDVSGLGDGTLSISLTLTDSAGNVSSPAVTDSIDKDASAPAVTSVAITDGTYAAGDSVTLTVTLDEDVTVSGSNATIALSLGGVTRQAAFVSESAGVLSFGYTVQADDSSDAAGISVPANGISLNGDSVRDAGGNDADLTFGAVNNVNAQIDSGVPVTPTVTSPAAAISSNAVDYAVAGSHAEDGVTISLYADADNDGVADNATVLATDVVAAGGWSLTAALTSNAANDFVVNAQDSAGNASAAVDVPTITQDAIAPAAPSAPDLLAASDSGSSDSDNITSDATPTFSGSAEANAGITVSSDIAGAVGAANADGSGNWSIDSSALSDGVHTLTARAADAAGNSSPASATLEVTIDSVSPSVSTVANQSLQPGVSSGALALTIGDSRTFAADLQLGASSSNLAVLPQANIVFGGSGADRTVSVTPAAAGSSVITLQVTDAAGNVGTSSFTVGSNSARTVPVVIPAGSSWTQLLLAAMLGLLAALHLRRRG